MNFKKSVIRFLLLFVMFSTEYLFTQEAAEAPESESLKVSGLLRVRAEVRANADYSDANLPAEYVGQKAQLSFEKKLADKSLVKITLQDARIWGGEPNSSNGLSTANEGDALKNGQSTDVTESTDLREAYLEVAGLPGDMALRLGRQKIAFGSERLFGSLDWTNIGRSFDGARLLWHNAGSSLSVWSTVLQEGDSADTKQSSVSQGQGDYLYDGLYYSFGGMKLFSLDLYYANKLNVDDSTTLKHHTAGGRIYKGKPKEPGLDFTLEGAYQFGKKNDLDIAAYAAAMTAGFTLKSPNLHFGMEADSATGDTDPADSKTETFDNLFHTNHIYYGQADQISWQNMVAFSGNVMFWTGKFTLKLAYWNISRFTEKDNWYSVVGGSASNQALIGATTENQLFHEGDVTLTYKARDYLILDFGYSYIARGDALNDAKAVSDQQYGYLSTLFKF